MESLELSTIFVQPSFGNLEFYIKDFGYNKNNFTVRHREIYMNMVIFSRNFFNYR